MQRILCTNHRQFKLEICGAKPNQNWYVNPSIPWRGRKSLLMTPKDESETFVSGWL